MKNENLAITSKGREVLTCPDLIISVDPFSLTGLHNSELAIGQEILVLGKKAEPLWRTESGVKLFSPSNAGLPFNSQLLN